MGTLEVTTLALLGVAFAVFVLVALSAEFVIQFARNGPGPR
jgi:hypothetical protein